LARLMLLELEEERGLQNEGDLAETIENNE
jgi:hypothetical protein